MTLSDLESLSKIFNDTKRRAPCGLSGIAELLVSYLPCILPPVRGGGHRRNVFTPFAMEKLEWCGYPIMEKL